MRRKLVALLALVVTALLIAKSLTLWIGAYALYEYKEMSKENYWPYGALDASRRARLLARSVRFIPADHEAWNELARFSYLLLDAGDAAIRDAALKVLLAALPDVAESLGPPKTDRKALLALAVFAYGRAAAANALDSGARFWGVMAKALLDKEQGESFSGAEVERVFSELEEAIKLDPMRPDRLEGAAEFAMRMGITEKSLDYDKRALALSLDGLDKALQTVLYSEAGLSGAVEIVPRTGIAQYRLSAFLFEKWHFKESEEAWLLSRRLDALPIEEESRENLAANGNFGASFGSSFHDWRIIEVPGVRVGRKSENGTSWLRMEFSDGPANYFHVYQDVPVAPGRYRFGAKVRAEGFEKETIIGMEVVHPMDPSLFALSDECVAGLTAPRGGKACDRGLVNLEKELTVSSEIPVVRVRLRVFAGLSEKTSGRGAVELTDVFLKVLGDASAAEVQ